jgi:uncharacterized protein YukE
MEKVPDVHIGFNIPGIGGINFDIPIPIYYESFPHKIAMDFTIIMENLGHWENNLDLMEQELIDANNAVQSDLRASWQGKDALEFFAAYDPMQRFLTDQLAKLREMAKLLHEEINDFGDMEQHLKRVR